MNIQGFYEYCLSLKGVTEHFPFDEDTLVFKVGNKMFALTSLSKWEKGEAAVNLKCNPERAEELREKYDGIAPGFHMSKVHWNTVAVNSDVPPALLRELITDSYNLILNSLTKKLREAIVQGEN